MIYRAGYVLPMDGETIENGEVLVIDGEIRAVGTGVSQRYPEEQVRDLGESALLPGFVNAHSHTDNTLRRHCGDALNMWDWLETVAFGLGRPTPSYELFLASATLGAAECARSGITCLGDCTFSGASAQAMDAVGLRGVVYKEIFGQSMGADYTNKFTQALDEARKMDAESSPRVRVGLSPHSVYTSNAEVLKLCAKSCADLNLSVAIHLAETNAEAEYTMTGTGPIADMRRRLGREPMVSGISPARLLEDSGLLRAGVCLAHCVWVSEDEVELISSSGAGVAHCPRSNAFLGCGVAPLVQFLAAGAMIGLGTDGAGSCGTMDFLDEMRFALALPRTVAKDAAVLAAKDVLRLATIGGARALGLDKQIGTLAVGKRADMTAIDLGGMLVGENLERAILSRGSSDIVFTMVDGVEIVRNGQNLGIDVGEHTAIVNENIRSLGFG